MEKVKWSERYDSLFQYYAQIHEMPWRVLKALAFAESGFNPDAKSSAGAMGLMQFMRITVADEFKGGQQDPNDPEEAIRAAAGYLTKLHAVIKAHLAGLADDELFLWRLAASSYNCGWGYVKAALNTMRAAGRPITWDEFTGALPKIEYKGKRPDAPQALNHGLKVVPNDSVLAA